MFNSQTEVSTRLVAEPDWRVLRAARRERKRGRREMPSMAIVRLVIRERDAFYRRAYSEDKTPSLMLRRFAQAYVNDDFVSVVAAETGPLKGPVNFALSRDLHQRLHARAKADGTTVSAALRRFVLAYVREAAIVGENAKTIPLKS
jgi:hypothetical protein